MTGNLKLLINFVEKFLGTVKFGNDQIAPILGYGDLLIEIVLFIVDSGCSKHMTGNLKLLINFMEKFMGTVKFRNDQIAPILGYGDLVGAVTIKRVYYVEGLNHNLFSVGQFCDADLEVAFRKSTCFIRDLKGNDLLTGSRGTDLYSITLQSTSSPNPICLMAKATSSQTWLWHRRLSHLNFDTINLVSKNDIVVGLPKLKFVKDHLCSSCELGKAKRKSFHTKLTPSSKSRYTWTHFLRSKDETPEVLIDFLRLVQRGLQAQVRVVRTDKGTEFLNQTLHAYFAAEGILHQTSVARTSEQNGVVERRNRTLIEATQTMLSTAKRTRMIMKSIHVNFDELPHMASVQNSSDPAPTRQSMASVQNSSDPAPTCQSMALVQNSSGPAPTRQSMASVQNSSDLAPTCQSMASVQNSSDHAPTRQSMASVQNSSDPAPTRQSMASAHNSSDPAPTCPSMASVQISSDPAPESLDKGSSVRTRRQLESDAEMCMFALTVSRTEPKNIKEAMADSAWIESMQEELHQFDRLD
nr:ribonuclease H-like domain-containing protein [Tanacetum cinerariifolium]